MAKGILGKSRLPPQAQTISKPVLQYTDALPRNDLREIDHGISYSRPIHQIVKARDCSRTPEGRKSKGRTEAPAPGFDVCITNPPADAVPASTGNGHGVDESMIGIALGSPRMLESQYTATQTQRIPPHKPPEETSSPLQRKPSKWRKIGGLFKAKGAMASNVNKPFYQVCGETERPSHGSSHSIDYKSPYTAGSQYQPIENTEVWPCLAGENEVTTHQQDLKPKVPGSLLQVEIPRVEMERYSVMFGCLLDKSQPSLLNRRSKTLDDVTIPNKDIPPSLGLPCRRATSPMRSRSPNLKLFPAATPTSKASKILGPQNLPHAPDPLRKAQTFHENLSQEGPLEDKAYGLLTVQTHPKDRGQGQSLHRPQASVTSLLSSTTIGSDDEPLLIHKIERVRTLAGLEEPKWEMVEKNSPVDDPRPITSKTLTLNTQELQSDSTTTSGLTLSSSPSSPILSPLSSSRNGLSLVPNSKPTIPSPPTIYTPEETPIPTVEVSIARSVSVSKGKKQVLVPVRTRTNHLNSNERLVVRQVKTPKVTGGQFGHRPGFSQDVRIEMA